MGETKNSLSSAGWRTKDIKSEFHLGRYTRLMEILADCHLADTDSGVEYGLISVDRDGNVTKTVLSS
jgi:hypothetical protein